MLSQEEIVVSLKVWKEGNTEILKHLYKEYRPLIKMVTGAVYNRFKDIDKQEISGIVNECFLDLCKYYNPVKGTSFDLFMRYMLIKRTFTKLQKKGYRTMKQSSIDLNIINVYKGINVNVVENNALNKINYSDLRNLIKTLPQDERILLFKSIRNASELLKISTWQVRKLKKDLIERLKLNLQ